MDIFKELKTSVTVLSSKQAELVSQVEIKKSLEKKLGNKRKTNFLKICAFAEELIAILPETIDYGSFAISSGGMLKFAPTHNKVNGRMLVISFGKDSVGFKKDLLEDALLNSSCEFDEFLVNWEKHLKADSGNLNSKSFMQACVDKINEKIKEVDNLLESNVAGLNTSLSFYNKAA